MITGGSGSAGDLQDVRSGLLKDEWQAFMQAVDSQGEVVGDKDFKVSSVPLIVDQPSAAVETLGITPRELEILGHLAALATGATGVRLSCQIICDHDMTVRAISRLTGSGRPDPGSTPATEITPPPQWIPKQA